MPERRVRMRKILFSVGSSSEIGVKLNELISEYQSEGENSGYAFADAIEILRPIFESVARKAQASSGGCCADYQAAMDDGAWKAFDTFDSSKGMFTTYLTQLVNNEINDVFASKEGTHARKCALAYEYAESDDQDRFAATVTEYCNGYARLSSKSITYDQFEEIPDQRSVEDTVIDRVMREEQRVLIDDLCERVPARTHEVVQDVVREVVKHPRKSFNAVAETIGEHHSTISRGLRKLAGFYDVKAYGDLNDYLYRSGESVY